MCMYSLLELQHSITRTERQELCSPLTIKQNFMFSEYDSEFKREQQEKDTYVLFYLSCITHDVYSPHQISLSLCKIRGKSILKHK